MDEHATALVDAIEAAIPRWVTRSIARFGVPVDADSLARDVSARVVPAVRELLTTDVDDQRTTPLAIVRNAVPLITAALRAAGATPVPRDDFVRERFPDDVYGLVPSSWADVDESLGGPGIAWGAAKAWEHKRRHEAS